MKDSIIESKVNKFTDISMKIKQFVNEKAAKQMSPFHPKESTPPKQFNNVSNKAKRSLTDWRQLYSRNNNKIIPRHTVYPATADGDRIRCSMTGQCNRRKLYSSAINNSEQKQRSFMTRQTKRERWSEAKRQSLVEFAFAQNVLQDEVHKYDSAPIKQRKIQFAKIMDSKRSDYMKVGQYLSKFDNSVPQQPKEPDLTETYINKLYNQVGKPKIYEYNRVRIKESQKLNNQRFLQSLRLLRIRRKATTGQKGLRYYQRA